MSQVMFSQPMSEVYVVFHKPVICVFAKKLFDLEARKFVSLSGGEKHCSVCLLVKIQQEVTVATTTYYYYHTTYLLLPTFTTTNLQSTTYGIGNRIWGSTIKI